MLFVGLFIMLLSLAHFYCFGKAIQSDSEKTRATAWLLIVAGVLTILTGANIVSRASRTASYSAPSPSAPSSTTFTMTDPKTGKETTVPLTNEENQELQKNPSAVLTKKYLDNQSSH